MSIPPVDPRSDRAVYKQIADLLRDGLDEGHFRPGDKLPSESELMLQFDASRTTVRRALRELAREGRVESVRGRGVFVRAQQRLLIHDQAYYLRGHRTGHTSPLIENAEDQGFAYRYQGVGLEETAASSRVAALLEIEHGARVFSRRRIVHLRAPDAADFAPAKLADSYLPLDVAVGRIREPDTGPGGTYARIDERLAAVGGRLTHFVEHLLFRMPEPRERRQLRLGPGVPVIDQSRVAYAGQRPVECFLAVLAGDKHRIEYRISADEHTRQPAPRPPAALLRPPGREAAFAATAAPPRTVDPTSDRAVYQQIADILRDDMDRGALAVGDRLPSESTLERRFDVTRVTVRRAIGTLAAEGRVRTQRGVGAFVKEVIRADAFTRQPYDRLARHHYRDEGMSALWVDAASRGVSPEQVRQDHVALDDVPAPPRVADRLKVAPGAQVFRRHRRMSMGGVPTQLTDSYLPQDLAVGVLREPVTGPGGTHARLEEQGHHLTEFVEHLSVRMPYPSERRQLQLERGVPVVDLYQTAYTADRPVECFVSVIAGDRYTFSYRIDR